MVRLHHDADGTPLVDAAAAAVALGVATVTLRQWARRHPDRLPRRARGAHGAALYRVDDLRRLAVQRDRCEPNDTGVTSTQD